MTWTKVDMEQAFIYAQGKVLIAEDPYIDFPKEIENKVKNLIQFSDNSYILCVSKYNKLPVFYIGEPCK